MYHFLSVTKNIKHELASRAADLFVFFVKKRKKELTVGDFVFLIPLDLTRKALPQVSHKQLCKRRSLFHINYEVANNL